MDKGINNNGYDYVDLGLPSGTLWATCNVGASNASDAGLYFQWGDTKGYTKDQVGTGDGKKAFTWKSYKWNPNSDGKTFTKYTTTGATLELVDDAAHIHMGSDWHMPSPKQIKELLDNTNSEWTTLDGVTGIKFTSKNGKFIFIPAEGSAYGGSVDYCNIIGSIWSSTLSSIHSFCYGQRLYFDSVGAYSISTAPRYGGVSVRGVIR